MPLQRNPFASSILHKPARQTLDNYYYKSPTNYLKSGDMYFFQGGFIQHTYNVRLYQERAQTILFDVVLSDVLVCNVC